MRFLAAPGRAAKILLMVLKVISPHARPDSEEATPAYIPCLPSPLQHRLGAAARPSSTSGLVSRAHGSRRFRSRGSGPPSHVLSARRRGSLLWDWMELAPGAGRPQDACAVRPCAERSFWPTVRVTVGRAPVRTLESTRNRFPAEQVWVAHGFVIQAGDWLVEEQATAHDRGLTRACPTWPHPPEPGGGELSLFTC